MNKENRKETEKERYNHVINAASLRTPLLDIDFKRLAASRWTYMPTLLREQRKYHEWSLSKPYSTRSKY